MSPERTVGGRETTQHKSGLSARSLNTESTRHFPDETVFRLKHEGKLFGYLFVDQEGRSLAWNGTIAFSGLEQEIVDLSRCISGVKHALDLDSVDGRAGVESVFFLAPKKRGDRWERVKYHLAGEKDYEEYKQALQDPFSISFVRYDVGIPDIRYAVTAENRAYTSRTFSEITVKLPLQQQFTPEVIAWALNHHRQVKNLRGTIDLDVSARTLSTLIHVPSETTAINTA